MKLNITAAGLAFGIFWAAGITGVTIISGLTNTAGEFSGYGASFIRGLMSVYPGYNISLTGCVVGALWGFSDGFVSAAVLAWLYNFIAGILGREKPAGKASRGKPYIHVNL